MAEEGRRKGKGNWVVKSCLLRAPTLCEMRLYKMWDPMACLQAWTKVSEGGWCWCWCIKSNPVRPSQNYWKGRAWCPANMTWGLRTHFLFFVVCVIRQHRRGCASRELKHESWNPPKQKQRDERREGMIDHWSNPIMIHPFDFATSTHEPSLHHLIRDIHGHGHGLPGVVPPRSLAFIF